MNIKIPITLSPHVVGDKPRCYYLLAQRLFPNGSPILRADQFIGFSDGSLILSVDRHNTWNTLFEMMLHTMDIKEPRFIWLAKAKLFGMAKGFRAYIPGTILKPTSAESGKINATGIFTNITFGEGISPLFYLKIPIITADILLGRCPIS